MARKALIEKNLKRRELNKKYRLVRESLKKIIKDPQNSMDQKFLADQKLQKLPRNSSQTRETRRCEIDGRAKGFMRMFGMSRIKFRDAARRGELSGIKRASW